MNRYVATPYTYKGDTSLPDTWSVWDRENGRWSVGKESQEVFKRKDDAQDVADRLNNVNDSKQNK